MRFKEIVDKYNWNDIKDDFERLYPDQVENFDGYEHVLNTLKELEPIDYDMEIVVEYIDEDPFKDICDDPDFEPYYSVDAKDSEGKYWAIEFTRWEKWLGMTVNPTIDHKEFLIHCLWEMTFCGYEQEEIQDKINDIQDTVYKIKNNEIELTEYKFDDVLDYEYDDNDEGLNEI